MLTPGGFLLTMKFNKPAVSIRQQLAIMEARGLAIKDPASAERNLKFIGYFRLSGYALPFQAQANADGTHSFIENTPFENVIDLYFFDRCLRLLVIDALEKIEVGLRSILNQHMSEQLGSHWYLNQAAFVQSFDHTEFITRIKSNIGHGKVRSPVRQSFIQHYFKKYNAPELPPSWMIFEILSMGTVSKIFKNIAREHQKPIAKMFNVDPSVLASWIHSLSYLRNLAAHHQRIWNRNFTIKPTKAKKYSEEFINPNCFYAQAVMIQLLTKQIDMHSDWGNSISKLFNSHPSIAIRKLGFPKNWATRAVWA